MLFSASDVISEGTIHLSGSSFPGLMTVTLSQFDVHQHFNCYLLFDWLAVFVTEIKLIKNSAGSVISSIINTGRRHHSVGPCVSPTAAVQVIILSTSVDWCVSLTKPPARFPLHLEETGGEKNGWLLNKLTRHHSLRINGNKADGYILCPAFCKDILHTHTLYKVIYALQTYHTVEKAICFVVVKICNTDESSNCWSCKEETSSLRKKLLSYVCRSLRPSAATELSLRMMMLTF